MKIASARHLATMGALGCAVGLTALPAQATEGYFALGYDAVQRGQGGAGVAAPGSNAMATAINPAAVAGLGTEMSLGLQAFAPYRGYTGTGTGFIAPGSVRSGHNVFPVPNFAYNRALANGAVLNFAAYGNGGMNSSYPMIANSNCAIGVFCAGNAGVDLNQLFLSVTYAQKLGNISWGVAPTIAAQAFKAWGLAAFTPFSSNPGALTDNGYAYSLGFGLRGGVQAELSPTLTVGFSAQTKMKMSKLKKYAGLFADGGSFDIPASATLGLAYKATPALTVLADVQRIWYSGVGAVSNSSSVPLPFGAPGGPGFGWSDVTVVKLGAVWQASDKMTWRFGYAHSTNPVHSADVALNILAPGVVKDHFTVGGTYKVSTSDSIDFSVGYVPKNTVTGPVPAAFGGGVVAIDMHQFSASVGWTRKF